MSRSRREFLQSSALVALGVASSASRGQVPAGTADVASTCQVPKMKFGGVEISRMVLGCNQLDGFSHFNSTYDGMMREWFTPERACELLHRAEFYGINAFQYSEQAHRPQD